MVYLDVHGHYPTHGQQVPFYALSFRASDSRYTRRTTRRRGFFHYHVPIPDRPFSGGLRFRCAPSLAAFAEGTDLLCPSGLPFTVPFANLVRRTSIAVTQSLLRDNLVTFPDILACHASFHNKPHPELPVVHAVGQPIYLHFRQPTVLLVPGPHSLLRCELYPAVAQYGERRLTSSIFMRAFIIQALLSCVSSSRTIPIARTRSRSACSNCARGFATSRSSRTSPRLLQAPSWCGQTPPRVPSLYPGRGTTIPTPTAWQPAYTLS
ncbi:hypothetical protein DFH06DRAFT_274627 [Mycena polygramma]|nr:hypothetical protein DFH06DRAFT_274627 [Mycena polygramma]